MTFCSLLYSCISGWHICSSCQKAAHYMCYTCTYSLCKGCIKDADYLCVRGNNGFCGTCMRTVKLIENLQGNKDTVRFLIIVDPRKKEKKKDKGIDMLNTPSVSFFFFLLVTFCCEQSSLCLDLLKKKKSSLSLVEFG